jgi:hypothetical protein
MPPVEFKPTISVGERPAAAHLLRTVTVASTSNVLPDDGVTALKHVGTVLMLILM